MTLTTALVGTCLASSASAQEEQEAEPSAAAPPEPPPPAPEPPSPPEPELVSLGIVFHRATLTPTLGASRFSGDGTDATGGEHHESATGAQLGILRPKVHVYDLGIDVDWDAFHGALFFGVGKTSSDANPHIADARSIYDLDDITVFRGGLELGTSYWIGDHLRWMVSGVFGFESVSMSLPGLTSKCGKNKKSTCGATASTLLPWIQPRLSLEVLLGDKTGIGVGAYVATDLLRPQDIETGLTLSLRGIITSRPTPALAF